MSKLELSYRSVESLIPYANNSRTHDDDQIEKLKNSITEFGFTNPILIDADGVLIAGHGRLMAANSLGLKEVPCIELGHLNESQRRAYVIADNRIALDSGWDQDALAKELEFLEGNEFNLDLLGFDNEDLEFYFDVEGESEKAGLTDDDAVPEIDEEPPISQYGDVWILGGHRVCCGDSTKVEDLRLLLGDEEACDACWTDPPYNVNYEGGTGLKIQNDKMSSSSFIAFMLSVYKVMALGIKPGGAIYVAHADKEWFAFRDGLINAGFKLAACLVWVKNQFVLGRSDYQWKHEPILYGWREGAAHKWYGGRKNTSVIETTSDLPITVTDDGGYQVDCGESSLIFRGENITVEEVVGTVVRADKPLKSKVHPTMKPVELILKMLRHSTQVGFSVLDLFGGSGSTLIACEKIDRLARLMELDPKYVDVIIRRWQEFTGLSATRLSDGAKFNDLVAQ